MPEGGCKVHNGGNKQSNKLINLNSVFVCLKGLARVYNGGAKRSTKLIDLNSVVVCLKGICKGLQWRREAI